MNTPAHIIVNLLCLGRRDDPRILTPVVLGATLPDAPMFIFYFVERILRGTPETTIWQQAYYQPHWQNFIDLFNSLPLMLLGLLISAGIGTKTGLLLFGSMILHVAGDLPLHHDDAHRHFFPFSNWRFSSPVSYWDSTYHGDLVSTVEILVVLIGCIILLQSYRSRLGKLSIALISGSYLFYLGYVITVWS